MIPCHQFSSRPRQCASQSAAWSRKGSFRGKSATPFPDIGWNSPDFDLYIETVVMSQRMNMDFTDDMWDAMSGGALEGCLGE
ncbi:hypothetical protein V5799_025609 [Amblyomma americanum]|uniref:Uncharacterized protein n=1 Tax=Amblyomma americanum TaxID=6943 RepID=A0AAQ4E8Y6_AMBAM